jgi:hypothetical protein
MASRWSEISRKSVEEDERRDTMSITSEVQPWVLDARMMRAKYGSTGKDAI